MRASLGLLKFLVFAVLLPLGVAEAEPVKVRVGYVVPGSDSPLLMFGKEGIARHQGASYALESIRFQGSPPMITALATGEIDFATLGFATLPLAATNAGMSDLRIIADVFQDGVQGYYSNEYLVLKDGPIKTVEDLKGKVLTSNGFGSSVDMAMRAVLKKHKLDDKKDVTIVESAFPNMKAMLFENKVDLITGVRPFSADAALREKAVTLFTEKDGLGRSQMVTLSARAAYVDKNRAALVDFLEDSLRALRWYSDPANHAEVVKIVSTFTKLPPAAFDSWYLTANDEFRDPNGLPDLEALQANIETQRELGMIKGSLDVKKLADLSLVKEAAGRLK